MRKYTVRVSFPSEWDIEAKNVKDAISQVEDKIAEGVLPTRCDELGWEIVSVVKKM